MKKYRDERLDWLNEENYDNQFYWNEESEIRKDIIDCFDIDEDEATEEEIEEYIKIVEWKGKGDYVYYITTNKVLLLEEALDNEFNVAFDLLEQFNDDEQREILEWVYSDKKVEELSFKINDFSNVIDEYIKNNTMNSCELEYSDKEVALEYLDDEIEELKNKGYNVDYIVETCSLLMLCDDVIEVFFTVIK